MSVSKPYAIDHGVANLSFVPDTHGDWALESGIYEIQPIPEPGTWLLVPTGSRLGVAGPQEKTWSVVRGDSPRDGVAHAGLGQGVREGSAPTCDASAVNRDLIILKMSGKLTISGKRTISTP
jgi:hypothetical protein